MAPATKRDVKRILVALDASPSCMVSLDMAAILASHMQVRLDTLFVEDINLLRLAALPFATELDRASGEARAMDEVGIKSAFNAHVARLKRRLEWFSVNRQIQYDLRTVQGDYLTEAMGADSDILFMFASKKISMIESVNTLRRKVPGTIKSKMAPVYTIYYGDARSEVSLKLAADIASMLTTELVILLTPNVRDTAAGVRSSFERLIGRETSFTFKFAQSEVSSIMIEVASSGCGLLVLPKHAEKIGSSQKRELQLLHCPVVLVG
ncbi:MAG: hypothetical protein ACR2QW_06705 [bacterium]